MNMTIAEKFHELKEEQSKPKSSYKFLRMEKIRYRHVKISQSTGLKSVNDWTLQSTITHRVNHTNFVFAVFLHTSYVKFITRLRNMP